MSTYTPEAFILKNQLVVTDTRDAVNGTSGAFVITGGASVSKSFIVSGDQSVGGQASINNVNVTPNLNDIIYEKQAVLSSDVTTFTNITGFYFLDSIASAFKAYITVIVTGPTNKYAFWELNSIYTPSGWAYTSTFTGDISGVNFTIYDNNGTAQIQYTNSNGAGYNTIIRYRAQTTAPAGSSPTGGTGLFNSTTNNYVPNTLMYANTSDTVASISDISYVNNVLNVGGATKMIVSKTTDATDMSTASFIVSGGAAVSKKLLVGSKIGVNTTNPGFNVDVNGDINMSGNLYQNGAIYSGSSLWQGDTTGNYYSNPIVTLLGINTTSPSTNLHVNGGFKTTTATIGSTNVSGASIGNLLVTNITLGNITPTGITTGNFKATNIDTTGISASSLNVDNFNFTKITIGTSLIPNANITYDLGSPTRRWKDLYLSGNTLHIGDSVTISATSTGNVNISSGAPGSDGVLGTTSLSSSNLITNLITCGSIISTFVSSSTILTSSISSGSLNVLNGVSANTINATSITSSNLIISDGSIGNLSSTNYTGSNILLSGTISSANIATTLVSCGSIGTPGTTIGNAFITTVSAGTIQVSGTVSAGTLAATSISNDNLSSVKATIGSLLSTDISSGSIVVSGNITAGGIATSSLTSGNTYSLNSSIGTLYVSNVSTGTVQISGNMSAGTIISSSITSGNISCINSSMATLNVSGITASNINFTGSLYQNGAIYISSQWTTNGANVTYTSGSVIASTVSSSNTISTASSVGTLLADIITTGTLYVSGSTISVNVTEQNVINTSMSSGSIVSTLVSSGSIGASGITVGTLYASTITSANIGVSGSISTGTIISSSVSSGTVKATNITTSNIHTDAGTLGPFIIVQQNFVDVTSGSHTGYTSSNTIVFSENGNPGINSSIGFSNGFGRLSDGSNDGMSWNYARLVIRGVSLNTGTSGSTIVLQPFAVQSITGSVTTQESFTVTDNGSDRGYTTWISPWFSTNIVNDIQSVGLKALSINGATGGNIRVGTTYMQFKA